VYYFWVLSVTVALRTPVCSNIRYFYCTDVMLIIAGGKEKQHIWNTSKQVFDNSFVLQGWVARSLLFGFLLCGFGEAKHQWMLLVTQEEQSHALITNGKIHFSSSPKNFSLFRCCVVTLSCSSTALQHQTEDWLFGEEMACTYRSCFLWISSSLLRVDLSCYR